jgi:hypothetical protein
MAKHVTSGLVDSRLRDLVAEDVQAFLEELPLSAVPQAGPQDPPRFHPARHDCQTGRPEHRGHRG